MRGDVRRVWLTPDEPGTWQFGGSFRAGPQVAVSQENRAGEGHGLDGATRSFGVAPRDTAAPGFAKWGRLERADSHCLQFWDGCHWIRGGVDSQGKGIVGAINYLATQNVNSICFMPMKIGGDGKDAWPFAGKPDPKKRDSTTASWDRSANFTIASWLGDSDTIWRCGGICARSTIFASTSDTTVYGSSLPTFSPSIPIRITVYSARDPVEALSFTFGDRLFSMTSQ